jgi:hypothetical protein
MNVLGNLDTVVNIVGICLTVLLGLRIFVYFVGLDELNSYERLKDSTYSSSIATVCLEDGVKDVRLSTKWLKPNIIIVVVCLVITTFIPSRDTMLTMLVADMITYENIELTKDSAVALVDYIVEQVKAITG